MKKLKILAITASVISIAILASCSTRKLATGGSRPRPETIQAALDSICNEGYNLFIAERINWMATDSVIEHNDIERVGGNVIWQPDINTWCAIFFDREHKNCIFELTYNSVTHEADFSYTTRPVGEADQALWEWKSLMVDNAVKNYGDSLRYNSDYGRPNIDIVRIDANTVRMYILQGVERPNVIPFGNDYSIDFDNNGNAKTFRRYHRTFLPIPTVDEDDAKVSTIYHSHLKDNPYITPTDICNFLLYGDGMKQTWVLSTALDGYIIYKADGNTAVFLTRDAMEKISKHSK